MIWRKDSQREVSDGLKPFYPRLWRYCLALTGNRDRAGDLAQSACLRALEQAGKFQSGTRLDLWMYRLTQRFWLNELRADAVRRRGSMVALDEIEIADTKPDPESNILAREVLWEVMALPEAQRTTVILVYVEGFSYKDASEVLDIPIGTVMSRLGRRGQNSRKSSMRKGKKLYERTAHLFR
jgi:RNA polymerase sigma-70 factor, ECF subfamily